MASGPAALIVTEPVSRLVVLVLRRDIKDTKYGMRGKVVTKSNCAKAAAILDRRLFSGLTGSR